MWTCVRQRDVRADLSAPFAGDGSQSFLSWVGQLEVAGSRGDNTAKLAKIPRTHLSKLAFLQRDSLPDRVQKSQQLRVDTIIHHDVPLWTSSYIDLASYNPN